MVDKDQEDIAGMHREFFKKLLRGTSLSYLHFPRLVKLMVILHLLSLTATAFCLHCRNSIDVLGTRTKPTILFACARARGRTDSLNEIGKVVHLHSHPHLILLQASVHVQD